MSKLNALPRPLGASRSLFRPLAGLMRSWLERRRQERRRRDGYRRLLGLDDGILADIGLRREQVEEAIRHRPPVRADRVPTWWDRN